MATTKDRADLAPTGDGSASDDERGRGASARTERLFARLNAEQRAMIARAAALSHQSLSQFLVLSAVHAADEVIRQHDVIVLSARDSQAVMEALLHPDPVGERLRRAVEHYDAVMGER